MLTATIKNLAPDTDVVIVEVRGRDAKDLVKVTVSRSELGVVRIGVNQNKRVSATVLGQEDEE